MRGYVDPHDAVRAKDYKCRNCNWAGKGSECDFDYESQMVTEVYCPSCENKLDYFGSMIFLDDDPELIVAWKKISEERRMMISQLKMDADILNVSFSSKNNEILLMTVNGEEVYEYDAGFEGWSQILDLAKLLREKFPKVKTHIQLDHLPGMIWGDDISASSKLTKGLEKLEMSYEWIE